MNDQIFSEQRNQVGYIVFNNPQRHNAVSLHMWQAADRHLQDFLADDQIRVIVLRGAGGKAFVSGANIAKFDRERASHDAVIHYNRQTTQIHERLAGAIKPTIAMIQGYCIGGGLALAVSCDLRICTPASSFGLPAARLGLGYPFDGLKKLSELVGIATAREMCFAARRYDADEARTFGLVNQVVADDQLEGYVQDYAQSIAANAPLTVAAMKQIFIELAKPAHQRDLDSCQRAVDACFESADYIEGRRAFMDKRRPEFKGS